MAAKPLPRPQRCSRVWGPHARLVFDCTKSVTGSAGEGGPAVHHYACNACLQACSSGIRGARHCCCSCLASQQTSSGHMSAQGTCMHALRVTTVIAAWGLAAARPPHRQLLSNTTGAVAPAGEHAAIPCVASSGFSAWLLLSHLGAAAQPKPCSMQVEPPLQRPVLCLIPCSTFTGARHGSSSRSQRRAGA